jgi:hypothetical protein
MLKTGTDKIHNGVGNGDCINRVDIRLLLSSCSGNAEVQGNLLTNRAMKNTIILLIGLNIVVKKDISY